jgi:predicted nucleic acid-binding protein
MSSLYILDTSALLTFIEDEDGAEHVEDLLRNEQVLLPWVVLLELMYITQRERGVAEAEKRYALIKYMQTNILWEADEPILIKAAQLKATHRLSLADAIIASVAFQRQAVLVHKDPEYQVLEGELSLETLPYKASQSV